MTSQPHTTLEEFLDGGTTSVYFMHLTLTPHDVCEVWDDVPIRNVPERGDVVDVAGTGRMGAAGRWFVHDREWRRGGAAVTVYVKDAKEWQR
jgi:hypothetical protein